jgi:hypothetical protein
VTTRHISNISVAHEDEAYKTPSSPSAGFLTTPLPKAPFAFKNPTRIYPFSGSAKLQRIYREFARGLTLSPLIFVLPPPSCPQWPRAKIPHRRYTVARRSASTTTQWLQMLVRNQSSYNGDGCGGHAKVAGMKPASLSSLPAITPPPSRRKKIKCDGCEPTCSQCSMSGSQCTWLQTKDRAALSRQYVNDFSLFPIFV